MILQGTCKMMPGDIAVMLKLGDILAIGVILCVIGVDVMLFVNDDSDVSQNTIIEDNTEICGDWRYTFNYGGYSVSIVKYIGDATDVLDIPESITYDGVIYPVFGVNGKDSAHPLVSNEQLHPGCILNLPNSLLSIGAYSFSGCSNFGGELVIPEGVRAIGKLAFSHCDGFCGTLHIPDSVTSIGESAFTWAGGFTKLELSDNLSMIGSYAFYHCTGFMGDLVLPEKLLAVYDSTFGECKGFDGTLVLPTNLRSIGMSAFTRCHFTGELALPASLSKLTQFAFMWCTFSGNVQLPDTLSVVECGVFVECPYIESVTIPESVTEIKSTAFYGCTNLKTVYNASALEITKGAEDNGCIGLYADTIYTCHTITIEQTNPNGGVLDKQSLIAIHESSLQCSSTQLSTTVPANVCTATPFPGFDVIWVGVDGTISENRVVIAQFT